MDAGGGVFATGDHEDLGAAMCRRLPRVGSMRRWYWPDPGPNGEPVAPVGTPVPVSSPSWPALRDRLDTLRPGVDTLYQFDDQSDVHAQPIAPRWTRRGLRKYPHPLLCSPAGALTWLPDHPHEGLCEVPGNLGRTISLDSWAGREYPDYGGAPLAPVVVADATVIGGHPTLMPDKPPVVGRTFGVIAAWDGHKVHRGRVVVDATWHHFFNVNLVGYPFSPDPAKRDGFLAGPQPNLHYERIKAYFRNIVYWLIPRRRFVIWMNALARHITTSAFFQQELPVIRRIDLDLPWLIHLAGLADHYFGMSRGACWRWAFVIDLPPFEDLRIRLKWPIPDPDPWEAFDPKTRPIHPGLSVSEDVLEDILLGSALASIARWAQENPGEEMTDESVARIARHTEPLLRMGAEELVAQLEQTSARVEQLARTASWLADQRRAE